MMQSNASQTKSKTKKTKIGKSQSKKYAPPITTIILNKPLKIIREPVKTQEKKRRNTKVKPQKPMPSKIAYRKKAKKKISSVSKKAIMQRDFLPLVSLPLAAGSTYSSFALVPIGDRQIGEAVRAIAEPDRIVQNATRMTAGAGQAIADTDREADFGWSSYEQPISEQVGEMFSFRVEQEDVSVKPEVWEKIIRTLPENFVIPDPQLTSFFDSMSAIQAVKEEMIDPELTSEPEAQPSHALESEGKLSDSDDSTEEASAFTDINDDK